jgi:1-pyrroline-5-carboxylate dehydrogenase
VRDCVATLTVGDPTANHNLGPVINQAALDSMLRYIEIGKKEGKLVVGGNSPPSSHGGYFLEPTVFADVAPNAALAQEEIFGPMLALIKVANFEEGLRVANNTEYGLTGSVYSSDRDRLNRARREFHVGNLYFNRKCTGAMVGAHPFGGFNMSGTDSKAGGPDYLYLFTQAKSVGEKL